MSAFAFFGDMAIILNLKNRTTKYDWHRTTFTRFFHTGA
ncbi:hypothetical protein CHCC20333_3879 [Bacillus paralicheniformis]|nr:hypothetical protein CHCC5021_4327 [Bacillus paralicheniformis]TWK88558.1 hypothetical protein CHCC20333_3879 [Bacillus paralicheniformis]TWN37053.1 hypothetical protein CHCC14527_2014 [Bacillus paralicheniformis]TWN77874.1 hypothetical protein CHCC14427_0460 [Bacillus paralicheniformis]